MPIDTVCQGRAIGGRTGGGGGSGRQLGEGRGGGGEGSGEGGPPPAGRRQYLLGSWDAPGSGFWLLLGLLKDFMCLALWTFKNYEIP